ncbi:MAG: hypothetical protein WC827_01675 [Candidatus Paceibacterota bacterium]|jgi:hypothetical protein
MNKEVLIKIDYSFKTFFSKKKIIRKLSNKKKWLRRRLLDRVKMFSDTFNESTDEHKREMNFYLTYLFEEITSEQTVKEIANMGFRPVTAWELQCLAIEDARLPVESHVLALGSIHEYILSGGKPEMCVVGFVNCELCIERWNDKRQTDQIFVVTDM